MRRPYIGPSESQGNAEILANRNRTYSGDHDRSISISWDIHKRQPADLRECVHMIRKAYSDEVPTKLHEGPDSIGIDGTPKMTSRAEGYIFGNALADDAGRDADTGERDLIGYYFAPFRALLSTLDDGGESERKRAAIVRHVMGGQGPQQAAVREGVPEWCGKLVAEDCLRSFLRSLTDLKLHVPKEGAAA